MLIKYEKSIGKVWGENLTLNWEKCHFMVKRGIVVGHIIFRDGIELDKAKTDLIVNLPLHLCERGVVFPWTCWFLSSFH